MGGAPGRTGTPVGMNDGTARGRGGMMGRFDGDWNKHAECVHEGLWTQKSTTV